MYVEKGQLLAQLDDSTYKADLEYAKSQLKQAQIAFKSTSALIEGKFASPDELKTREAVMEGAQALVCLLYTSPSPRDQRGSRMPSSA